MSVRRSLLASPVAMAMPGDQPAGWLVVESGPPRWLKTTSGGWPGRVRNRSGRSSLFQSSTTTADAMTLAGNPEVAEASRKARLPNPRNSLAGAAFGSRARPSLPVNSKSMNAPAAAPTGARFEMRVASDMTPLVARRTMAVPLSPRMARSECRSLLMSAARIARTGPVLGKGNGSARVEKTALEFQRTRTPGPSMTTRSFHPRRLTSIVATGPERREAWVPRAGAVWSEKRTGTPLGSGCSRVAGTRGWV